MKQESVQELGKTIINSELSVVVILTVMLQLLSQFKPFITQAIPQFMSKSGLLNSRAPGGPVTFWWPMWGQMLPKLLKLPKLQNVTFYPKTVKIGAKLKMTKTALSGVSKQSSCQGVCQSVLCVPECFASQTRPVQAQRPCPAFPSLPWLISARSGPRSLAQLPRGPGRVPIIQGASQRSYRAQEPFLSTIN